MFSGVVFLVEYVLRVWSVVEKPTNVGLSPLRVRFLYVKRPLVVVELLSIVGLWSSLWTVGHLACGC